MRLQDIACSMGTLLDLSASGMRIRTRGTMPTVGTKFAVTIQGLEESLLVECVVRWTRKTGMLSRELGIEFENVNAEIRRSLTELAKTAAYNEFVRDRRRHDEEEAA